MIPDNSPDNSPIDPNDLLENVQTLLGVMLLAHPGFGSFMDWLANYVTAALLNPVEAIEGMSLDIQAAKEVVHDHNAAVLAEMQTAGGVH